MSNGPKKTKVLIVDDSAVVRQLLTRLLGEDPAIEVVGSANDPYEAREKLVELDPDVMVLDIEMPRMDGLSFLQKVMEHRPTPTVIVSSLSARGSRMYLRALECGAVTVIDKPAMDVSLGLSKIADSIIASVLGAARAHLQASILKRLPEGQKVAPLGRTTDQIVAIASSTGGTIALQNILPTFPRDFPGTLIVQHFPPIFSTSFAEILNQKCPMEVREAKSGDRVQQGTILVAPGNFHTEVLRSGGEYRIHLSKKPAIFGLRPAADILFNSIAENAGANALGVILTGMGTDGSKGLLKMRQAGSYNIAQDERTSVIFGMPARAIEVGAINQVCPLEDIPRAISSEIKKRSASRD